MLLKIPCVAASPSSRLVPSPIHTRVHAHTQRKERERKRGLSAMRIQISTLEYLIMETNDVI